MGIIVSAEPNQVQVFPHNLTPIQFEVATAHLTVGFLIKCKEYFTCLISLRVLCFFEAVSAELIIALIVILIVDS